MCYQWRDNSNMKNFCTLQIVSIDIFVVIDFSSSLLTRRKVQTHKNRNRSFLARVAGMFRMLGRLVKMKSSLNVGEKQKKFALELALFRMLCVHKTPTDDDEKWEVFPTFIFLSLCLHLNSTQSAIHLASFFSLSCSFTSLSYYQCELQHIFTQHSMGGMLCNFCRKIFLW